MVICYSLVISNGRRHCNVKCRNCTVSCDHSLVYHHRKQQKRQRKMRKEPRKNGTQTPRNSSMVRKRPLVSLGVTLLQNKNREEKKMELDVQRAGQFCLFVLMCFFSLFISFLFAIFLHVLSRKGEMWNGAQTNPIYNTQHTETILFMGHSPKRTYSHSSCIASID